MTTPASGGKSRVGRKETQDGTKPTFDDATPYPVVQGYMNTNEHEILKDHKTYILGLLKTNAEQDRLRNYPDITVEDDGTVTMNRKTKVFSPPITEGTHFHGMTEGEMRTHISMHKSRYEVRTKNHQDVLTILDGLDTKALMTDLKNEVLQSMISLQPVSITHSRVNEPLPAIKAFNEFLATQRAHRDMSSGAPINQIQPPLGARSSRGQDSLGGFRAHRQ